MRRFLGRTTGSMWRIDSHQHFWRLDRADYGWLTPDLNGLYRDYTPDDLAPYLREAGIHKTVLVQAAPTLDETHYLLELANDTDFIAGVVGWVDMEKETFDADIAALSRFSRFLGIRPMIQDIPDPDWMLQPDLQARFDRLASSGLTLDALVRPQHLDNLYTLLRRHPELRVVIDHGAKPDIASDRFQRWSQQMRRIASMSDACCKLSGLVTEAGEDHGYERLRPYVDHLVDCFGAERLMWGSDWPVLNLASSYLEWVELTDRLLGSLDQEQRNWILGGTAQAFYDLRFPENDAKTEAPAKYVGPGLWTEELG